MRHLKSQCQIGIRWLLACVTLSGLGARVGSAAEEVPPAHFQKLIDAGNVTFKFYDPRIDPRPSRGFTEFKLRVHRTCDFRYSWTWRGRAREVTIHNTVGEVKQQLSHTIHLPESLDNDRRWSDLLVKHEFDHVAISVDPRAGMLLERLLRNVRRIDVTAPAGTTIDNKFIQAIIDEELGMRTDAVIRLIESYQQRFDEVTRHGAKPIPDRKAFFHSLYTEPSLDRANFAYTGDVGDLLKSETYRKAKLPYRIDGEPTRPATLGSPEPNSKRAKSSHSAS